MKQLLICFLIAVSVTCVLFDRVLKLTERKIIVISVDEMQSMEEV